MTPNIRLLTEKILIGMHLPMSFAHNRTGELWQRFMPKRNDIPNRMGSDLISLQVYAANMDFSNMSPMASFEKWAAVEVAAAGVVPEGMEQLILPGGLYAVFDYKGSPQEAEPFFRYVFGTWLPSSGYEVDSRPHFEVLGPKYQNNDPQSEEEVWIPIRKQTG